MIRIFTIIICLTANIVFGQASFDKFTNHEDVNAVIVNKKMFEMMSKVKADVNNVEVQKYFDLIKNLDNLKVFVTTNPKVSAEMKSSAENHLKTAGLDELMQINQNGKNVKIHAKPSTKKSHAKELLMFIDGKETILLSLIGDFNLNDVSLLTDHMNLPGGDDLKKAASKK
ncbi:MAG: DUF4252 domain-containing protein [Flavobacteriaceae bacterium]|jgi:hypothetical protein|nr:DUF4252 domain-containing protein [Flavobacteriaceae bacterium]